MQQREMNFVETASTQREGSDGLPFTLGGSGKSFHNMFSGLAITPLIPSPMTFLQVQKCTGVPV